MKHGFSVWNRIAVPALSGAALLVCADVHAQTSSTESTVLKEVVVTATRRSEDVQKAALSVSVLTGEMIEDKGVFDLYMIQYAAPSVSISHFGSANEFNIRGIGRTQVDIDVPSGVIIYRDGAPTITGYFQTEPYFDIESVEVLRGPQGTFVGKNASGGAVFVNTNDPDPSGFAATVEAGVGNNNMWDVSGIVNMPLGDTSALRMSYKHLSSDDFYDSIEGNITGHPGERDLNSFRAALKWEPSDNFTGILKADYHDLDFGGNVVTSPGYPLYDVVQNGDIRYKDESTRVVADLKYRTSGGVTLSSVSAYQQLDSVNNLDLSASNPVFYQFKSNFDVEIISQELNLISPEDQATRWIVGAFYFEQQVDIPDWTQDGFTFTGNVFGLCDPNAIPPSPFCASDYPWFTTPWDKHEDEWAVFAHLAHDLSERLELEGGLRYTDYSTSQVTDYTFAFGDTPPILPYASGTQSLQEDSVDYQAALNYDVSEEHFVYGLISRGHTSGGINIFPPYRIYKEMEVLNFELGWKATWLDGQVRSQAAVYKEEFDNYQVNFESQDVTIGQDNRNAPGDSSIWGIELSTQAHVGNTHLDAAVAYMDSDIGVFRNIVNPFTGEVVDLSHQRTPYSPDTTANVGLAYDFHLAGNGYMLTPRVDVSYVSATQTKLWDTPLVTLEERTLVNARLVLMAPDDKWSATLWATNLFDEEYVAGIQNLATLIYAGRPLEYGLSFKYQF